MIIPNNLEKPNFGINEGVWEYYTIANQFIGYIVRKPPKKKEEKKYFLPFTYHDKTWVNKWDEDHKAAFYNAQWINVYPDKPIMIVEGEKTAEAAQKLFPEFICLTWKGGAAAINNIPIEQIKGRKVCLWPDNDMPGINAMAKLKELLAPLCAQLYLFLPTGYTLEKGWDLADFNEESDFLDLEFVRELIREALAKPNKIEQIIKENFPDLSKKFNPLNTSDNIVYLLNHFKIKISYNSMTHYPEFSAEIRNYSTVNETECFFTEISNLCVRNSVPKVDLASHILFIADQNRYHPAMKFIESKPWDNISRISEFLNTVQSDNQEYSNKLIYRWLISCIAVLYADKGLALEGVLVFQGKQKIGKTYWFKKLVPEPYRYLIKDSLSLDPNNKDSVMTCTSCWLGELGELDGTIKKSEVEAQKQFLTRSSDEYRIPFGKRSRKVPRNTAFFGSVNPAYFLEDASGNRRYWTISVTSINYNHTIDMQQLWAEIKTLYDKGESYQLTDEEQDLINKTNLEHTPVDPLEESILNRYHWDDEYRNHSLTAKEVLLDLNYSLQELTDRKGLCRICANILAKLTGQKSRSSNGRSVFDLPRSRL